MPGRSIAGLRRTELGVEAPGVVRLSGRASDPALRSPREGSRLRALGGRRRSRPRQGRTASRNHSVNRQEDIISPAFITNRLTEGVVPRRGRSSRPRARRGRPRVPRVSSVATNAADGSGTRPNSHPLPSRGACRSADGRGLPHKGRGPADGVAMGSRQAPPTAWEARGHGGIRSGGALLPWRWRFRGSPRRQRPGLQGGGRSSPVR